MLANETPNVAGAADAARRLLRDGNRASEVITRLRALFSKKPSAAEPVDLNDAAREVIELSRSDLRRAHATLSVELPDGLPPVLGDRVQLQQVILNLLRNACDAMVNVTGRPKEIVVSTAREGSVGIDEHVRLSVRDSGVGFGPAEADRLFEAFHSTKPDGMGIGLSVCRSIIENHRGRIWATPNDGPGVTFTFSIPVAPDDAVQPSARQLASTSLMS
jgi:signal transduction histidine kinase